ncbi:hypothetical protein BXZ70DRAFT_888343 [Cristinia sonorae]|uniref:Uncharacterized protein n=1 Tax=Cristinia sonorae TaxID=1940300 RepID=A0A8K0UTK8_9AGAR|nr:hypothetical protein BXZ70DRAFT_888343 [Cristinia sonorae]
MTSGNDSEAAPIDNQDHPRKRMRITPEPAALSQEWFPWDNKLACTVDILMHLPRSVFSQRQLDIFLWVLNANGITDTPSVKSLQNTQAALQAKHGIRTLSYKGALGHNYSVNSLADIIAHEMANPRTRQDLHFFPEDAGTEVNEYWHASHWREEADLDKLTPMVNVNGQHYYVFEPCILRSGTVCMPFRWLMKDGHYFAQVWPLFHVSFDSVDGLAPPDAWVVARYQQAEVPAEDIVVGFGTWTASSMSGGLPHCSSIHGCVDQQSGDLIPWNLTNPTVGNRWRALADGARVLAFPIWLYCDDTSGNVSKKWNKHNSFLFTPAGLPSSRVHEEYNIHFLCTSNIAPPLEMLDGIVEQLEETWNAGVWTWDCVYNERVLVIPSVVALLGDNPMQSELSCHVGLGGRLFCRVCKVSTSSGNEDEDEDENGPDGAQHDRNDDVHDSNGSGRTKKKKLETMAEMKTRITNFLNIGSLREKEDSMVKLRSLFTMAKATGNQQRIKSDKTKFGLKDTFLEHFLNRLVLAAKGKKTVATRQAALDACSATFPDNESKMFSPVWRIKGLDPHTDTPVEILHVVLLGFVKYFWRDVIQNQLKNNDAKKALLATRLSDLDVSGLGISKLAGHTLVQYAGSLTGRDFRVIAQVAPFVIHDLVSSRCYEAWIALSAMIPLIWQPKIPNITTHLENLRLHIKQFLAAVARWNPQWFNKPKFHILLHLVDHIRRFGPASLFATEGFESFNAIIRAKSVHSNRLAPSRDIAIAFAQGYRVRHLLCGGLLRFCPQTVITGAMVQIRVPRPSSLIDAGKAGMWYPVGPGPHRLIASPNVVTSYLGINNTQVASQSIFPNQPDIPSHVLQAKSFRTNKSMTLLNGDVCSVGQWVLVEPSADTHSPTLARVEEILTRTGTDNERHGWPDLILLQNGNLTELVQPYNMPSARLDGQYQLTFIKSLLCTANLQHSCATHQCSTSGFVAVRQERQLTEQTRPSMVHIQPDDMVLNTARIRDSIHMTALRHQINPNDPNMDLDNAIMLGVTAAIDRRKQAATTAEFESQSVSAAARTRRGAQGGRRAQLKSRARVGSSRAG